MRAILQDFRYTLRALWNSPGFTAVAALTLALGIAANTAVFSWLDAVLLRPLPGVADHRRLAVMEISTSGFNNDAILASYADYRAARDNLRLVSGIAAYTFAAFNLGDGENPERVWGELVSGNYFAVLGVKPLLGRVFSPEEYGDKPGAYPVAVIGERLWRRRFNADPGIVGATIRLNRRTLTVVGVAPAEFRGSVPGSIREIWAPLMMTPQLAGASEKIFQDGSRNYWTLARLRPGITVEQARAEAAALMRRLAQTDPRTYEGLSATMLPVWKAHNGGSQSATREPLLLMMGVCVIVLAIVCANVANLLLARSIGRRKALTIRLALGASRWRIARQLLAESLLLAALGAFASLPLARLLARSVFWLLPPHGNAVGLDIQLSGNVLAFTILVCVAAAVASGLAPVLQTVRTDVIEVLKESGRGGSSGGHARRLRSVLVAAEVALALVALVGAGLFASSFRTAAAIHPGFDTRNLAVAQFYLSTSGYSADQGKQFCLRLRDRLKSAPGIADAVYANRTPGVGLSPWSTIQVEGYTPARGENMKIYFNVVAPGYFGVMRIPQVEGRDFTEQDDVKTARVVIVNDSFARRFFAGRSAIGRKVRFRGQWSLVAGVVKDSTYHNLTESPVPFIYSPFRQQYASDMSIAFFVRGAGDAEGALGTLRREAAAIDPGVGMADAMPMAEQLTYSLLPLKVMACLLTVLGAISLLLAAVGLYSVMAYAVSQRTNEIGLRMALGAPPLRVLAMVVGQGMRIAGAGLLAGIAAALAAARLVSSMLVRVSAADPAIFAGAALFLASVAVLACYIPARRATKVDPIVALRYE